jgi:hypothetical protein
MTWSLATYQRGDTIGLAADAAGSKTGSTLSARAGGVGVRGEVFPRRVSRAAPAVMSKASSSAASWRAGRSVATPVGGTCQAVLCEAS